MKSKLNLEFENVIILNKSIESLLPNLLMLIIKNMLSNQSALV